MRNFVIAIVALVGCSVSETPEVRHKRFYDRMAGYHASRDPLVPDGAVLFIGDSITQGLCVSAVASPAENFGIGADTTDGVLARLDRYESIQRARAVVLEIGVNDKGDTLANYRRILDRIPCRVIVCAILPTAKPERNARNKPINEQLRAEVEGRENAVFVDTWAAMSDGECLRPEFDSGDGVHLSADGYRAWAELLKSSLEGE